ncbi:hypothetical protein B7R54_10325 [Subtercola boreus]|uniref:Uncharacterized protein n=1 Tax=Subtercola boreus TaxID=120213 RepID=A0A3E0VJK1_9MICO|nr:trypsin-like peptidase domain-containing protein [Subtercola boreus]RFA09570.1 hypothetical protein B7R54_10325 [Subtercola boreus]TQL53357.1 trypsin-like peptidase [Subtercola boreus]
MNAQNRPTHERLKQGGLGALLVCGALVAGVALTAAALPGAPASATKGLSRSSVAMAEPVDDLSQEHLAAIGEAGTVYLSGTWSGFVNFPLPDGTTAWSDQIDASFSCSGFVASSDGYIVTAGHCADVAEGKTALVDQFLSDEVANGDITEADAQGYIAAGAEGAWPVEGQKTGEAPVLAMKVYPAISISADNASGFTAVLQDDRPLSQGDVALFKIDAPAPLPVLLVSGEQPATGQKVDAIGYPGNVTDLVSGNPQPTFAQGQVSGRQQTDGGPFTQIGVTMSPGMSGGPVINGTGDVVGAISFGPSGDTQQLNFAAAPETISALLARNGVKNTLSDADTFFRAGLSEYFDGRFHAAAEDLAKVVAANPQNAIAQQYQAKATEAFPRENTTGWILWAGIGGGVFLLLVIGLVVLLVLRGGRKRRATAAASAGAPFSTLPAAAGTPAPLAPSAAMPAPVTALSEPAAPVSAASSAAPPAPVPAQAPPAAPSASAYLPAAASVPVAASAPAAAAVPPASPPTPASPPVPAESLSTAGPHPAAAPLTHEPHPAAAPLGTEPHPAPAPPATDEPHAADAPLAAAEGPAAANTHCGACGRVVSEGQRFCTACGHPLSAAAAISPDAAS